MFCTSRFNTAKTWYENSHGRSLLRFNELYQNNNNRFTPRDIQKNLNTTVRKVGKEKGTALPSRTAGSFAAAAVASTTTPEGALKATEAESESETVTELVVQ